MGRVFELTYHRVDWKKLSGNQDTSMIERDAAATFTTMLHAIDSRDWQSVRRAFADTIAIDYSSLFGVPAAVVDADEHVAGWEAFARHFDATQHVTGPIVVASQSDEVAADTHVRAYHQMKGVAGGDIWMVAGHYHVRLRSLAGAWKIAGLTLQVFYQEGNLSIPDIARSRMRS
jgi:SnoaL-like domain